MKKEASKEGDFVFERMYFNLLVAGGLIVTLGFGVFYFLYEANTLATVSFVIFCLFVVFWSVSRFTSKLLLLFRLSVLTSVIGFYMSILYTGGLQSPALPVLILPVLFTFLYKPETDRYYIIPLCLLGIASFLPMSEWGYTRNLASEEAKNINGLVSSTFIFVIVVIYTFLFWYSLSRKNKMIARQMNELQETTGKLMNSEKMVALGMMSAYIAHELNSPLNHIKGSAQVLDHKINQPESHYAELAPLVKVLEDGIDHAFLIVKSVSQFSRSSSSTNEACHIQGIIENCLIMVGSKLSKNVKITKHLGRKKIFVEGNEGGLHQVFLNMIVNAVHAVGKNGEVTVTCRQTAEDATITIADNGVGISKENLERIPELFFTTKPSGEGTGLGLPISYKIIENHGGTVAVESAVGVGTTFTLRLPLKRKPEESNS